MLDSLKSIPGWGLSLVVLFAGAVKLFSVSKESAPTAVAIIRTTSTATLLAGTFASLLPAFVAVLIALGVWWWAETVCPSPEDPLNFDNNSAVFALGLLGVVAFFTMPVLEWMFFAAGGAALFGFLARKFTRAEKASGDQGAPAAAAGRRRMQTVWTARVVLLLGAIGYGGLAWIVLGRQLPRSDAGFALKAIMYGIVLGIAAAAVIGWSVGVPRNIRSKCRFNFGPTGVQMVKDLALAVAGIATITVLLTRTMWLPVERVTLGQGVGLDKFSHVEVETQPDGSQAIAAYVLKRDADSITLLTDQERAVIQLAAGDVASHQVCVSAPTSAKWLLLYERPSQIISNIQLQSPYKYCPQPGSSP